MSKVAERFVALCAAFIVMSAGGAASAQNIYQPHEANDNTAPAHTYYYLNVINVTKNIKITKIEQNINYLGSDLTGNFVIIDTSKPFSPMYTESYASSLPLGGKVWVGSGNFSYTLEAGKQYAIGFAPGASISSYFYNSASVGEDLSSVDGISTYGYFYSVTGEVIASSPFAVRLHVSPIATVPTMTEWAMIGFALALAGGAALLIQRRRRFA